MSERAFDEHAEKYDGWFLQNRQVLESEVRLIARCLGDPGRTLSVGCGSGLFESILRREHGIAISEGVEPSREMAAIARKRGLEVEIAGAEQLPCGDALYDTVLLNGVPSYLADVGRAFAEAFRVLRPGGRAIVADVPAESAYALLYRLAVQLGTWDDPVFAGVAPAHPYPVEFAAGAHWRTTPRKLDLLREAGFVDPEAWQTLTRHPVYTDDEAEDPVPGHDRGGYVAVIARRPS